MAKKTQHALPCTALVPYQPAALVTRELRPKPRARRLQPKPIISVDALYRYVVQALIGREWGDEPSMRREIKQHCRTLWRDSRARAAAQRNPRSAVRRVHHMIIADCVDLGVL